MQHHPGLNHQGINLTMTLLHSSEYKMGLLQLPPDRHGEVQDLDRHMYRGKETDRGQQNGGRNNDNRGCRNNNRENLRRRLERQNYNPPMQQSRNNNYNQRSNQGNMQQQRYGNSGRTQSCFTCGGRGHNMISEYDVHLI